MATTFGTWLQRYDGDEVWLQKLSAKWGRALGDDYLKPIHYGSLNDVIRRMQQRTSRKLDISIELYRAWSRYSESKTT